MGDEELDSLLTGEMSLLVLWLLATGLEGEEGLTGICHEGILGPDGEGGNCLLREREEKAAVFRADLRAEWVPHKVHWRSSHVPARLIKPCNICDLQLLQARIPLLASGM